MNEGFGIDVIYLDYRKAFDTVHRMSDHGVSKLLDEVPEEKVMRIFVTSDLQPSTQCINTANKVQVGLDDDKQEFSKD